MYMEKPEPVDEVEEKPARVYKTCESRRRCNKAYSLRHPEKIKQLARDWYEGTRMIRLAEKQKKDEKKQIEIEQQIEINRSCFKNMGMTTFPKIHK